MTGKDEELINRVRELPEDKITGTHYTKDDMLRRLKAYRTANNSVVAEPSVQDFYKKWGIGLYHECIKTPQTTALGGFKIYIERVRTSCRLLISLYS